MRSLGSGLCGGDIFVGVDVGDDDEERTSFDERLYCRLPLSGQMRIPVDSATSPYLIFLSTVTFLRVKLLR